MAFKALTTTFLTVSLLAVSACQSKPAKTNDTLVNPAAEAPVATPLTLAEAIADTRRDKDKARDKFRHPLETLEFFDVAPGKIVAEIWPGWYTPILAPYLADNDGKYVAVLLPEIERFAARNAAFKEKYEDTDTYGTIEYGQFSKDTGLVVPNESVDVLLTFRNVHNWMGGGYAEDAFKEFYAALKPGGILGIVEHRLPESATQDPRGATGYVQESYMKALAKEAGFEFVGSSEVNANPRDTADHPYGVWTLPPRSRTPEEGSAEAKDFNASLFKNIGESDRATLKFRKPVSAE